jgi:hypothetical protein
MRSFTAAAPERTSAVFAFEDADVHVSCNNRTIYKVHSALLTSESPVLADLIRAGHRCFSTPIIQERRQSTIVPKISSGSRKRSPHKHSNSIPSTRGAIVRHINLQESEVNLNMLFAFLYPQFKSVVHADNVRDALRLGVHYQVASIVNACMVFLSTRATIFEPLLAVNLCHEFGNILPALNSVLHQACRTILDDVPWYSTSVQWSAMPYALQAWLELRWRGYAQLIARTNAPNILQLLKYEHAPACQECEGYARCEERVHEVLTKRWYALCNSTIARSRARLFISSAGTSPSSQHLVGLPKPSEVATFYSDPVKELRYLSSDKTARSPCHTSVSRAMHAIAERVHGEKESSKVYRWLSRTLSAQDIEQLDACIERETEFLGSKQRRPSDNDPSDDAWQLRKSNMVRADAKTYTAFEAADAYQPLEAQVERTGISPVST